jgi:hypothetical protein
MGKGGGTSKKAEEMMAASFKDMSGLNRELQTQAAPWRTQAGNAYMDAYNDPSKFVSPGLNEITRATGAAQNSVEQMAPGGARDRASRDLRMNSLNQKASMLNSGRAGAAQALGNLGIGQTQTGISAMGQANNSASSLGQMGQAKDANKASSVQGFGSLLGGI